MWRLLDARDAQFPAEHNFGHHYYAKAALIAHYKNLDPSNCLNPGIGRTSKRISWQDDVRRGDADAEGHKSEQVKVS